MYRWLLIKDDQLGLWLSTLRDLLIPRYSSKTVSQNVDYTHHPPWVVVVCDAMQLLTPNRGSWQGKKRCIFQLRLVSILVLEGRVIVVAILINALSYPSFSLRNTAKESKLQPSLNCEPQNTELSQSERGGEEWIWYFWNWRRVRMCSCIVSSTYGARGMRGSLRASKMRIGRSWGLGGWDCNSKCASNSPAGPAPTITVPAAPASAIACFSSKTTLIKSLQSQFSKNSNPPNSPSFYPPLHRH